jgi:Ni,Fe-hydrogenase III small subunit
VPKETKTFKFNSEREADAFVQGVQAGTCSGDDVDIIRYLGSYYDATGCCYNWVIEIHRGTDE